MIPLQACDVLQANDDKDHGMLVALILSGGVGEALTEVLPASIELPAKPFRIWGTVVGLAYSLIGESGGTNG